MHSRLLVLRPLACTATSSLGPRRGSKRPGLAALLDYAREGDAIVPVGIDRGRNAAEVMTTVHALGERGIVPRSLREGIDTSNATGRMVAGMPASLAELELELRGNVVQRLGTLVGHADSPSAGPRYSISRKRRWRDGCMPAVLGEHHCCRARRKPGDGIPSPGRPDLVAEHVFE
jgi:Resolvase, N terminal domain